MKNNETPDESESPREDFSNEANNYVQIRKYILPQIQRDILACEEKLKDIPVDPKYIIEDTYGGRGFYTIKNSKIQKYWKKLDAIITTFYQHVEKELASSTTSDMFPLIKVSIEQRKTMVKKAIIKKIHDHQMDKLVTEYNGGKEKYDCSPMVIATINRWENTYITHIFNPIKDMEIIPRVGGSSNCDREVRNIYISKDVFSTANDIDKDNDYLPNLLGYETKEDLLAALKSENEQSKNKNKISTDFAKIIKKRIEEKN